MDERQKDVQLHRKTIYKQLGHQQLRVMAFILRFIFINTTALFFIPQYDLKYLNEQINFDLA